MYLHCIDIVYTLWGQGIDFVLAFRLSVVPAIFRTAERRAAKLPRKSLTINHFRVSE